ncbi:MAG: hypothetical protein ACRD4X_14800 [Candidatus Acidiferrales bacterium]
MASAVWKPVARWCAALIVCAVSFFFVFLWIASAPVLEHGPAQLLDAIHFEPINAALDLISIAIAAAVFAAWIAPSCYSVGFALGSRPISRIQVAAILWLGLVGLMMWRGYPSTTSAMRTASATMAGVVLVAGTIWSIKSKRRNPLAVATTVACLLLLALPFWVAFAIAMPDPPQAQLLWSVHLENHDALGMNTSSEYGSQRQVVIVGDRVVVAYDIGSTWYEDRKPMSSYRLVSLDLHTGATKNSKEFVAGWGIGQPYLNVANDGRLMLVHARMSLDNSSVPSTATLATQNAEATVWANPGDTPLDPRTLSPAGKSLEWAQPSPGGTRERYVNDNVVWDAQYGTFAAASDNGSRYAFEFSDSRGDFPEVLYEHFIIYDAASKQPIAIVRMKNLPERQSWSALSGEGEYFVCGSPRSLNLYRLPE